MNANKHIQSFSFDLTQNCSLQCKYCFRHIGGKNQIMSFAVLQKSLDYIINQHCHTGVNCSISVGSVGEPLLNYEQFKTNIAYILDRISNVKGSLSFDKSITTNATVNVEKFLSDDFFNPFICVVSIDGLEEKHNTARIFPNGNGSYKKAMEGAMMIRQSGKMLAVSSVMTAVNHDVWQILNHLIDNDFRNITIKPVRLPVKHPFALTGGSLLSLMQSYNDFVDKLYSLNYKDLLTALLYLSDADYFNRFLLRILRSDHVIHRCPGGKWAYNISPDGRINPCSSFVDIHNFDFGDIYNGINSAMLETISIEGCIDNNQHCLTCDVKYICGGPCHHNSAMYFNYLFKPDDDYCNLIKHIILLGEKFAGYLRQNHPRALLALPYHGIVKRNNESLKLKCKKMPKQEKNAWNDYLLRNQPAITLDNEEQVRGKVWNGCDDISANIRLSWDDEYFYLSSVVTDAIFYQPYSLERYNMGDNIRFVLSDKDQNKIVQISLALINQLPVLIRVKDNKIIKNGKVVITREQNTTLYECRVPWDVVGLSAPKNREERLFGIAIHDNDGKGLPGWIEWSRGVLPSLKSDELGSIRFINPIV